MDVTIANEKYPSVSRCILGLRTYCFSQKCRIPDSISEERVLCIMLVLQALGNKIFAYQPPQESVSHTIKATLQRYFRLRPTLHAPSQKELNLLEEAFSASKLVRQFIESNAVNDISGYLNTTLNRNALEALRQTIPQTGKPLRQCSPNEIAKQKALLSADECAACWAAYGPRSDTAASELKNALVCGKYLVLLDDETLKRALTDPSLYTHLNSNGKRACVEIIAAVFPLMDEAQKQQIERLTTQIMADYREEILSLRHRFQGGNYGLMDLFHIGDKNQFKQALLDFGHTIVRDKGVCFYINYDVSSVLWSDMQNFSVAIESLAALLHRDFLQNQARQSYEVWENDTFKIIWLISVVWFRKLFHDIQASPSAAGK